MPIIKQAIKRAKQAVVRRSRNLQVKRAIKQDVTALHTALETGKPAEINEKLSAAYSEIDRAVKKGTLHKNTAARRKAQLAVAVAKVATPAAAAEETKTTKGAGKKASASTAKTAAKKPATAKKAPAAKKPATKKTPAKKTEDK
jgi:small subunit ribosomal protein S20